MITILVFTLLLGYFIGFKNIKIKEHLVWTLSTMFCTIVVHKVLFLLLAQLPIHPDSILLLIGAVLSVGITVFIFLFLFYNYLKEYYTLSTLKIWGILILLVVIKVPLQMLLESIGFEWLWFYEKYL